MNTIGPQHSDAPLHAGDAPTSSQNAKTFTEADLFPGKGSTRTVTLYNVPYSEHRFVNNF